MIARTLTEAGEASGYRVDGLRTALAGEGAPAGTASSPRLPRATGLPKGPADHARAEAPTAGADEKPLPRG